MNRWTEVGRFLIFAWFMIFPCCSQIYHPLPVLWLMPVTPPPGQENLTAAVAPAIKLALQDLRRQPPPLGSYEIHFQLLDSQCDSAKGLKVLFDAVWTGPKYLVIFGGVCSSVMTLMTRSLQALNLMQVSFAATAPALTDRGKYPNFFSTIPSERTVNRAVVKLLQSYRWSRVGILTHRGQRFSEMRADLIKQLMKADIQIVATESYSDDPCMSLKKLKDSDTRIIIGQFAEHSASDVFCCAYRLNLFGGSYQWILTSGSGLTRWRLDMQGSGCTPHSLLTAREASITLDVTYLSDRKIRGISGRTPKEYEDAYFTEVRQEGVKASYLHGFAYDGVWVIAKALSQVMEAVRHREKFSVQRNLTIREKDIGQILLDSMKQMQFEGVTGPVLFRNGERVSLIELRQFQETRQVVVGQYNTYTKQLKMIQHTMKFKDGRPAKDQTLVLRSRRHISPALYITLSSVTALAIFIILIVLSFIVKNSKPWQQRGSSLPQDSVLLLAMVLSSCSVFIHGLEFLDGALKSDSVADTLCSVHLWLLSLGHTVGFGTLCVKIWRILSICVSNGTEGKKSWMQQPDWVMAGMLLLDVFVLTSWQIMDPVRRVVSEHSLETAPNGEDIIRPYSEQCGSIKMDLFITVMYGYKGPLLGLGCFLAWKIRGSEVSHPPDHNKHLALSVCAVVIASIHGVLGSSLTSQQPNIQFCLTTLAILFCNTTILALVFGPKVVYISANGSEVEHTSDSECGPNQETCEDVDGSQEDNVNTSSRGAECFHSENHQLRRRITLLDMELETNTMQLHEMSMSSLSGTRQYHISPDINNEASRPLKLTHQAQICSEDKGSAMKPTSQEDINSPEHLCRRRSIQLPILHHAYLPVIGGATSCSSLCGGPDTSISIDR